MSSSLDGYILHHRPSPPFLFFQPSVSAFPDLSFFVLQIGLQQRMGKVWGREVEGEGEGGRRKQERPFCLEIEEQSSLPAGKQATQWFSFPLRSPPTLNPHDAPMMTTGHTVLILVSLPYMSERCFVYLPIPLAPRLP